MGTARDHWTVEAMLVYGGGFVRCLARTAQAADDENLRRLKAAWPEYWSKYEAMGEQLRLQREGSDA